MDNKECAKSIEVAGNRYTIYDINELERLGIAAVGKLPLCIKVLVENVLRKLDGEIVKEDDLLHIARWRKHYKVPVEIPFYPARVLTQDFTGVPAVVDLAAMRDAMVKMGGDPRKINPLVPVDLIIDHSVQVDFYGTAGCEKQNVEKEYQRNGERYALLKWAQKSFDNFRIVPPRSGICHQVNLEYLSRGILTGRMNGTVVAYPETIIGTDSHTTMINAIGVVGWGVGGIEAEAVMLGQPCYMAIPEVIGVRLSGQLKPGVTATDLALYVTQVLRKYGVVEKFVEYFGPGVKPLSVPERATLANMAPEYGATMGFMPVDERTIQYLKTTNRETRADLVEACSKALGLFYTGEADADYTDVVRIDLNDVEPAVAGPSRPYQRILLSDLAETFKASTGQRAKVSGERQRLWEIEVNGRLERITDGSVVMAAITSCTNTSNPDVLMGAGLVARNAVARGLRTPAFVKTVLAPGSKVVARYLDSAGLTPYLQALGFHLAGFGCMTCIGNGGPLHADVERVVKDNDLTVAAVISGNRNFEARIHPRIKLNFLMSPMLVVAFALAGRIDIDLATQPLGLDPNGQPVYLGEIWPEEGEIGNLVAKHVTKGFFASEYAALFKGDELWQGLEVEEGLTFAWAEGSSYIKAPPYFQRFTRRLDPPTDIAHARALILLGDSVTTDHISPAGSITEKYPAGQYLIQSGVSRSEFNSYGSRRGNHEVMLRGAFGNIRLKNRMVAPLEGSFTRKFPEDKTMPIYDAAGAYRVAEVPLLVLAGREYGTGSSRDWAAKGTRLLGIKAVLAESFERIHRSNLVGMGVLPLTFRDGDSCRSLGLDGSEEFHLKGINNIAPRGTVIVTATKTDGSRIEFEVTARLDTAVEVAYFMNGGILPFVLRKMLAD
jgi:aconitate hydratase